MARYEVVAALRDMEQLDEWERRQSSHSYTGTPPSSGRTHPRSPSLHSTASTSSNSSTSTVSEHELFACPAEHATLAATTAAATSAAALTVPSPPHIAQLQSAWHASTAPTFIDSVTDLSILGEGSSGIVYRGMYRGLACVVKLPKAVSLTGAAWREWQCHLSLPPHPNLVRFLGAPPMSATNYLVLSFVRQGSLHSLLASSTASSAWYSRPYGVMRCMRDMAAVLQHIHSCGIVHRDVSARNILVDSDGSMVLADLGLAAQHTPVPPAASTAVSAATAAADCHCLEARSRRHTVATPTADEPSPAVPVRWTSPEALKQASHYSSKSDVWSLGVALWECTAGGRLPYGQCSSTKACIQSIVAQRLGLHVDEQWGRDATCSAAERQLASRLRSIIQRCLTYDVEQRPDSEQLLQLVDSHCQQWRGEAAEAAHRLDSDWHDYHAQQQQRLGKPVEHTGVSH